MDNYRKTSSKCCRPVFLTLLLLVFNSVAVFGQDANTFNLKVKFSIQGGGLDNALITITKNGAPYRVIDPSKSKYVLDLELGANFLLVFTKQGYITKSISVDTHVPQGREKGDFVQYIATVELARQPEDQEITYTQPVGHIKYENQMGEFDADKDYSQKAQDMVKKAEDNPKPKPKPPAPNPRQETKPIPAPSTPPSNPIPVVVKQPEYKPEPVKPKPAPVVAEIPVKPIVKNKEEKTIQEDRRKLTIITVNIDGVDYVYRREHYSWGGLYYYKDGKNITESTFEKETE
jgi:hypothetical protein